MKYGGKNFRRLTNTEIDVNDIPYNLTFHAVHVTSLLSFL